jgi:hypothetical protein
VVTLAEEDEVQPSSVERHVRFAIAGHERGAVRRIILYVLAFLFIGATYYSVTAIIGALVIVSILAMTDQLA